MNPAIASFYFGLPLIGLVLGYWAMRSNEQAVRKLKLAARGTTGDDTSTGQTMGERGGGTWVRWQPNHVANPSWGRSYSVMVDREARSYPAMVTFPASGLTASGEVEVKARLLTKRYPHARFVAESHGVNPGRVSEVLQEKAERRQKIRRAMTPPP